MKFTDRGIRNLQPRQERYEVASAGGGGLLLRVTPNGVKTFAYLYRVGGRQRRLTLGRYPATSLAEANRAHAEAMMAVARGEDPAATQKAAADTLMRAPTVAELAADYIERWAKPRKRTWREDARMLKLDVIPRFGSRKAADMRRQDILRMLDEMTARGATITANRTLAVTRRMFNWAIDRDILESSPCARVKAPAAEVRRDRVLSLDELRTVWTKLPDADMIPAMGALFRFMLLTAQRKGEVMSMAWSDIANGWWTIPGSTAKNGLAHRVPLTDTTLAYLPPPVASPWVFPSPRDPDKHMGPTAPDHAMRRNLPLFGVSHFTPHDLRRTAASHMAGMGIPRLVIAKILNHTDSSVTAIYDRHSYDREKREALTAWEKRLMEIVRG